MKIVSIHCVGLMANIYTTIQIMKSLNNCECEKLVEIKVDDIIPIAGIMIEVRAAPALVCQDCGEIQFDGKYILDLEKKVRQQQQQAA